MQRQRHVFTVSLACISRAFVLRDRVLGRIGQRRLADSPDATVSRHCIPSGNNLLDAAFVQPAGRPTEAVMLICHGIAEIVEHWIPVQQLLAANGVASLVFDYSGYGRSTGFAGVSQCELDAISAFEFLQRLVPSLPVSLLGFSMGSGVAAAIVGKVATDRLMLCAAFTSFREGACSLGIPRKLTSVLPAAWSARERLRDCSVPVLILHGDRDRMFPVGMASELKSFCGPDSELIVVPGLTHTEPFNRPRLAYWGLIVSRLVPGMQAEQAPDLVVEL